MLKPRTFSRFVARLLIGVLVFAQMALAAYACPIMAAGSMSAPTRSAVTGTDETGATRGGGMGTDAGGMDSALPTLCLAHCQIGQQTVDSNPAPMPIVALLTGYHVPAALDQTAARARPFAAANDPPPRVDPPHAILHCCFRI